jgi:N-acetylmuramidase
MLAYDARWQSRARPAAKGGIFMPFVGRASPLSEKGFHEAAAKIKADPIALWAIIHVETNGAGFLPDRRPKILFERHKFRGFTEKRFDELHPDLSGSRGRPYGDAGSHQYTRLEKAIALHREAALNSASWGLPQIMCFNSALAGYRNVEEMVIAMMRSEDDQLMGMVNFLKSKDIPKFLATRDWASVAENYNGKGYKKFKYDEKLADAYRRFKDKGLPKFDSRAAQLLLTYNGFETGGVDGAAGAKTKKAIEAFRSKHRRAVPRGIDGEFVQILTKALPSVAHA